MVKEKKNKRSVSLMLLSDLKEEVSRKEKLRDLCVHSSTVWIGILSYMEECLPQYIFPNPDFSPKKSGSETGRKGEHGSTPFTPHHPLITLM